MFGWFTKRVKAAVITVAMALVAVAGVIVQTDVPPEHTVVNKGAELVNQHGPKVIEAIEKIPAADEARDAGR